MFRVALCLWTLLWVSRCRVGAIVIATHCVDGILLGADSLETTQSVLVDQLYAQKIYQVSPTAYVCLSTMDARGFQLCQNLRMIAKSAALRGKTLKVSELASYAQNLAESMIVNPHLLIVGYEDTPRHSRYIQGRKVGDHEDNGHYPQKIFEISPSGFMTEQTLAATGMGSNSALLLMDLTRTLKVADSGKASRAEVFDPFLSEGGGRDGDENPGGQPPRKASIHKTTKKIHRIIRGLRASDAHINGKVRIYLIPSSKEHCGGGILSIKDV